MERLLINDMYLWKNKKNKKPLLISGPPKVGKTYLLKNFASLYYKEHLYIDFSKEEKLVGLFTNSPSLRRSIELLGAITGYTIVPFQTLLIFDNIHVVPEFSTLLIQCFNEIPHYYIICGSRMEPEQSSEHFAHLKLYALNFEEFLMAIGQNELLSFCNSGTLTYLPMAIEENLNEFLKLYFILGGLPEVINAWNATKDLFKADEILYKILAEYKLITELEDSSLSSKINFVWKSIPLQLINENRKFKYSNVRPGARKREYQCGLDWLEKNNFCTRLKSLKSDSKHKLYIDEKTFRLFYPDIGLLRAALNIPIFDIYSDHDVFLTHRYVLTLQFIYHELKIKLPDDVIYFWTSKATAELDFLFHYNQHFFPMEINLLDNRKARSSRIFYEKHIPDKIVRTSLSSFRNEDKLLNLPLYMLFQLEHYLTDLMV